VDIERDRPAGQIRQMRPERGGGAARRRVLRDVVERREHPHPYAVSVADIGRHREVEGRRIPRPGHPEGRRHRRAAAERGEVRKLHQHEGQPDRGHDRRMGRVADVARFDPEAVGHHRRLGRI
jgi:hypothetical protein